MSSPGQQLVEDNQRVTYWIKGYKKLDYTRASVIFEQGTTGGGKSRDLEYHGERNLDVGNCVLDGHCANDNENLAWARPVMQDREGSPYRDKRILLLRGPNTSVTSSFTDKNVEDLVLEDFTKYDLIIAPPCNFYPRPQAVYDAVNHIVDLLYYRESYDRLVYLLMREASSLWYSRLKLEWAQLEAKARMIYMLREMRHSGVSLGLDTLKDKSIDADIRNLIDFLYLRKQGAAGLPEDLHYVYSYFDAEWMQRMPVNEFVVRTKEGDMGWGRIPWASWHKVEKENMRTIVGVVADHSDPEEGKDKKQAGVDDEQHARMVRLYHEVDPDTGRQYSMAKIGKMLGRSPTTVQNQLVEHDVSIQAQGYCPRCRRAMTSK